MTISSEDLAQFQALIGAPAWGVARWEKFFFTLEFGPPRLTIQEKYHDPAFRRPGYALPPRRRIVPRGEWSLAVEYADWEMGWDTLRATSAEVFLRPDDAGFGDLDDVLRCLDGQKLARVEALQGDFDFEMSFDLGGFLKIGTKTARYARCWSLSRLGEDIAGVEA